MQELIYEPREGTRRDGGGRERERDLKYREGLMLVLKETKGNQRSTCRTEHEQKKRLLSFETKE